MCKNEIKHICSQSPIDFDVDRVFTDRQTQQLLRDIFNGKVDPDTLPVDTYNSTGEILTRGAVEGIKNEQLLGLGFMPDQQFMNDLQDNAYKFAGAKTLDEVIALSDALIDPETKNPRTWSQFKEVAHQITENHRVHWLRAEYNNAMSSAQMASKWDDLVGDDDFPYLKYITAGDGRVRNHHARLDGTILPKEHTFWSQFYPPNGWNCRCTVVKLSDLYDDELTPQSKIPRIDQPDEFNINVGTHRVLFSPEHDYFTVAGRHQKALDVLPKPGTVGGAPRVNVKKEFKEPEPAKVLTPKILKAETQEFFDNETDFNVNKITISSKADKQKVWKQIQQVKSLFREYRIPEYYNHELGTKIMFASTRRSYGYVRTSGNVFLKNIKKEEINFGHETMPSSEYSKKAHNRSKSRVDIENADLSTTTHEFFHVLSTSSRHNEPEFWKGLKDIRNEYSKELMKLNQSRAGVDEIDKIHLGTYSHTNIDEFGAEGFKEYKLSKSPSKYAQKVGELIDKYFKK